MNSSSQPNYSDTPPPAADGARTVRLVPAAGQSKGQSNRDSAGPPTATLPADSLPGNKHAWRTRQLNEMGLNAASIAALVRARVLIRARHGCYVRAEYWDKFDPRGQERLAILLHAHAAVSSSWARSVYSHASAARLHGLPLWRADKFIHLTLPAQQSTVGRAPDVRIHCRPLLDSECTQIDGVTVTNVLRTSVDCALTMNYKQALILMDHALRTGIPRAVLQREAAALDGHRGIRIFRAALDFASASSESAGESLTRDLIATCNIEPPVQQFPLSTRLGGYRADFAWPQYKVILEFDGEGKYFNYRPTPEVLREERRRENVLIEQGWTVIRIGWNDLFNERVFKSRLLAALRKGGMK